MEDPEAIKTFYENIWTTTEENANLYQAKLVVAAESTYAFHSKYYKVQN
jgi:hypothetical protein